MLPALCSTSHSSSEEEESEELDQSHTEENVTKIYQIAHKYLCNVPDMFKQSS